MQFTTSLNIKIINGKQCIFSLIRKKWLVLTPEEEVRQKLILFLIHQKQFPLALIQEEREFEINRQKKRFDLLVYNTKSLPLMLIECKAHKIPLNDNNFQQIFSYIQYLKTPYFMFANGLECRLFSSKNHQLIEINPIPFFVEL